MKNPSSKNTQKKKRRFSRTFTVLASTLLASFAIYAVTSLFLRSYSNELSMQNQQYTSDIEQSAAAIEQLKGEISQLQEKSRVLGMLEGQVTEDSNNVYYYGND